VAFRSGSRPALWPSIGIWGPGLDAGPYLMLDDTLVAAQSQVRREVNHPSRLPDPIVTGYEDGCFQPWVSVVRDPQTKRFRMWYNIPAQPLEPSASHLPTSNPKTESTGCARTGC